MARLTDLPAELIETVLVVGNSGSIAALSQTSKFFYELIYRCPDQHLWREIFLAIYDDPRPALNHLSIISGGHPDFDIHNFDWKHGYINRISAGSYIRHSPPVLNGIAPLEAQTTCPTFSPRVVSFVKALLSAITTSTPTPSSLPVIMLAESISNSPLINSPSFPPLLFLLTSTYNLNTILNNANAPWLHDLLETGFPPELTRTLLARLSIDVQGHAPYHPALTPSSHWEGSEIGHLFHKLVSSTGFIPIPKPELAPGDLPIPARQSASSPATPDSASATDEDEDEGEDEEETRSESLPPLPNSRPRSSLYTPEEQYADARILARRRVYDMRYLRPTRMWGPFHHVRRDTSTNTSSDDEEDEEDNNEDEDEDYQDEDDQNNIL